MVTATLDPPLSLNEITWDVCLPRPKLRTWDVILEHIRLPEGQPFNAIDYPFCEGIADEFDNPLRREIVIQTAARVGKTTIALSLLIAGLGTAPAHAMFSTSTQTLAKQTVRGKIIPMLRNCDLTSAWVPPDKDLSQTRLDLAISTIYVGWSGSPTTLGDVGPKYLLANEVDKWSKAKSEEADPLELVGERGLEIPDGKQIIETTPTVTGVSRINKRLLAGTNCRYQVPCPKCGKYQQLIMGRGDSSEGGIIFDKGPDGAIDSDLAWQTARYQCKFCHNEIHDEQRRPMIRRGIWVPEGQYVTKKGHLRGHALHNGPCASFQLSRLYSPTFTFADIARKFVAVQDDFDGIRNFTNSWLGETFTPRRQSATWDEIAQKLCCDTPLAVVPEGGIFLTCGVDVQIDHLVFVVTAWGLEGRGWVIDYGIAGTWDELSKEVINRRYYHADGGERLPIVMTMIDSGYEQDEVKNYCQKENRSGRNVWPLKGSKPGVLQGKPFRREAVDDPLSVRARKRRGFGGIFMISVNTNYWQGWMDNCLYRRTPGKAGSLMFTAAARDDQDLFEQLINEVRDEEKGIWMPISDAIRWDFRDCLRYARCAGEVRTNGNWQRLVARKPPSEKEKEKPATPPKRNRLDMLERSGSWIKDIRT